MNVRALFRRLDDQAHEQLCAAAARLAAENEDLCERLRYAEDAAESWRDDAMRLSEEIQERGGRVSLAIDGSLHGSLPA